MNISPKHNPEEFNRVLFHEVGINLFQHKYLKDFIDGVQMGYRKLYDASLINTNNDGWILILHGDILLVYGHNWNKSQLEEIKKVFDLNEYTNYAVAGEAKLVKELVDFFKVKNHELIKERIFYQSDNIIHFPHNKLIIAEGNMAELNELSLMLQKYYHEEYKGENDKSLVEMQQRMFHLIQSRNIYTLKSKDGILSFCTVIDPDIGILFTKSEQRKKGYAKILLSYCSKLLERRNGKVFVMTDKNEFASNRVCKEVGFEPFYEYAMFTVNND